MRVTVDVVAPRIHVRRETNPSRPPGPSIGALGLLADGRTAALVAPDGDIVWLCWPRVDSDPLLLSLLDPARGGTFSVRPVGGGRQVAEAEPAASLAGLVHRTVWGLSGGRLTVDDALTWDRGPELVRALRAEGAAVRVEVRFRPAFGAARAPAELRCSGVRATAAGGGTVIHLAAPGDWREEDGTLVSTATVHPGVAAFVVLGDGAEGPGGAGAAERFDATVARWRAVAVAAAATADLEGLERSPLLDVVDAAEAERLLVLAGCVLTGLRQRGGGIVAAPTTSLPQWPGTARTWDYRYSWLRDTALAARALLRLGLVEDAHGLGAFCGDLCETGPPPPLARVDGTAPPPETELDHLAGWGGSRPVRVGNAAAGQAQHDAAGEVLRLAGALAVAGALPTSLRGAVPRLADRAAAAWEQPDHGIWEVRGARRAYTHSRVASWAGLQAAVRLGDAGVVDVGSARRSAWRAAALALRVAVLDRCVDAHGALTLHEGGGGPDSALAEAVLTGFLAPDDPRAAATLDSIRGGLVRGGLCDRYLPEHDHMRDACAPFVFPTFWLAAALRRTGAAGRAHLAAAAGARGAPGLMGEVADPETGAPLGNYPQVQSHAALVLCALDSAAEAPPEP